MIRMLLLASTLAACSGSSTPSSTYKPNPGLHTYGDGIAAFETVRAVFQHPRCQNCHPAGDAPLQGDDGRVHNQNVLRGPTGNGMVGAECSTCHGPANPPSAYGAHVPPGSVKNWRMPPPEMKSVFVGVAPGELCRQIKDPARNGNRDMNALRMHLDDPLVTWGWEPGFGRAPIPISRDTFLDAWQHWVIAGAPCPE